MRLTTRIKRHWKGPGESKEVRGCLIYDNTRRRDEANKHGYHVLEAEDGSWNKRHLLIHGEEGGRLAATFLRSGEGGNPLNKRHALQAASTQYEAMP